MKNKLTNRWIDEFEWKQKWIRIARWLLGIDTGNEFDSSYYLPNGKLDLRGIDFCLSLEIKESVLFYHLY